MRTILVLLAVAAFGPALAEVPENARIYRCPSGYEAGMTFAQARSRGCEPVSSKELTEAEREKYLSCQMSAGQAPTEIGAQIALRACRERFEQKR
jgi:hypothetical protein